MVAMDDEERQTDIEVWIFVVDLAEATCEQEVRRSERNSSKKRARSERKVREKRAKSEGNRTVEVLSGVGEDLDGDF